MTRWLPMSDSAAVEAFELRASLVELGELHPLQQLTPDLPAAPAQRKQGAHDIGTAVEKLVGSRQQRRHLGIVHGLTGAQDVGCFGDPLRILCSKGLAEQPRCNRDAGQAPGAQLIEQQGSLLDRDLLREKLDHLVAPLRIGRSRIVPQQRVEHPERARAIGGLLGRDDRGVPKQRLLLRREAFGNDWLEGSQCTLGIPELQLARREVKRSAQRNRAIRALLRLLQVGNGVLASSEVCTQDAELEPRQVGFDRALMSDDEGLVRVLRPASISAGGELTRPGDLGRRCFFERAFDLLGCAAGEQEQGCA
jgi:hypothetical protein